jgi:hypothetical protein
MSEAKCYNCGKLVAEQDMTVKNVSTGMFSSERKIFHSTCWKTYRANKIKRDAIEYAAIADGGFMVMGIYLVAVFAGLASYMILGCTIAVMTGLGYAWFKVAGR